MFLLWLLHPFFQDMFFPALRVLPRSIFGKSSLCLWFLTSVKAGARFVWEREQQYWGQQRRRSWAAGIWLMDRGLKLGWEDRGRLEAQGEEFRETLERNGMIWSGRSWIFVLQPCNSELGYTGGVRTSRDRSRRGWGLRVMCGSRRDGVTLGHLHHLPTQTTRHSQVCGPGQIPNTWWNTPYSQEARGYLLFFFNTGKLFCLQQMWQKGAVKPLQHQVSSQRGFFWPFIVLGMDPGDSCCPEETLRAATGLASQLWLGSWGTAWFICSAVPCCDSAEDVQETWVLYCLSFSLRVSTRSNPGTVLLTSAWHHSLS